jgi:hypothetical protein
MTDTDAPTPDTRSSDPHSPGPAEHPAPEAPEHGGPKEQQPTRYGDWTVKGRCIDF